MLAQVKEDLSNMTENMQADCVPSRQARFNQCFLNIGKELLHPQRLLFFYPEADILTYVKEFKLPLQCICKFIMCKAFSLWSCGAALTLRAPETDGTHENRIPCEQITEVNFKNTITISR